ncbi:MAG: hypothetical protein GF307_08960 [candidate division Zixibacteria bacterium]|nr:hypothetical protein [candidate division Zixibacteria bacterium]
MSKQLKNKISYIALAVVFALLIIGSISTLLSARKIALENSDADDLQIAYHASLAGVEMAKHFIETNRCTASGKLPVTFHLNGALYEVTWGDLNTVDSTIHITSYGNLLIDDILVERSKIDTTIHVSINQPDKIDLKAYFGG